VPGLSKCKSFTIRASFVKNPEFVYRPLSDAIRELRVTENDFYGVMKFNMVYFVCVFPDKFKNLRVLDFHGDVEEPTLIQLLVNIKLYPDLKEITLCNKSSFFDVKQVTENIDIQTMGLFNQGYNVSPAGTDRRKFSAKFSLPGLQFERHLSLTFLNY
jgi:hypothetical protein